MSSPIPITLKQETLYVAYAPEFDLCSYGVCQDEALNNLTDEIEKRKEDAKGTGYEGKAG